VKNVLVAAAVLALSACAAKPAYVSSSNYQAFDCSQLAREYTVANQRLGSLPGGFSASGIGVGIAAGSWGISPQVSMGVGRSTSKNQKSQLLGEIEAIERSAEFKGCVLPGATQGK
jgi:hypothetical protein